MNITGISAAVNYVKIQPVQKTTLHSNDGTEKVVNIPALWEKDYTKSDAVSAEFCKRLTNYVFGNNTAANKSFTSLCPTKENLQALENQLQTSGISKEMDLDGLTFDLKRIGFDTSAAAYSINEEDFTNRANYLASRYVAAEDKIKHLATGDAQAEQLRKLDEIYQNALDRLAESYSSIIGSYLDKNGVSGEKDKIYNSVVSGVESKVEEYRTVLSGNAVLESLKGPQDEWVLDNDAYVASVLREKAGSVTEISRTEFLDAPYTMEDLEILGQYVSALSEIEAPGNKTNRTFCTDEARLGVEYAMLDMKTDKLQSSGRVSEMLSELLQKTKDGFMRSYLERLDQELTTRREDGGARDDRKGFAALDRSAVWDVYRYTMQEYKRGKDVIQTLLSGVKYGSKKTAELLKTETYRAKDTAYFWADFFEQNKQRYKSSDSSYQKYLAGWRDFEASLSSGASVRMNLELKSSKYYTEANTTILNKTI